MQLSNAKLIHLQHNIRISHMIFSSRASFPLRGEIHWSMHSDRSSIFGFVRTNPTTEDFWPATFLILENDALQHKVSAGKTSLSADRLKSLG